MEAVEALHRVRDRANELQKIFKEMIPSFEGNIDENEGISLLHANFVTLLRYNLNLIRMAQARVRGTNTTALASTLVEDWVALNKIRPLQKKLEYQIDALLKNLAKGNLASRPDEERYRPNPSALVFSDGDEDAVGGDEDGVYRPPRIAEVVYDENDQKRKEKEHKEREKFQARKIRTEGVREMLNEIKGRPEEIRDDERDGTKSKAVKRLLREDEERRQYEEENFVRLNLTKKDKKRRREIERAMDGPTGDGIDEFDGLEAVADRVLTSKGSKDKSRSSGRKSEMEEQYKLQQLDQITEQMNSGPGGSSGKSKKKRQRKSRG